MRVQLAVAARVNNVYINVLRNMAAGASRTNMGIYFLPIVKFPQFKQALVFTCLQYKSFGNTVGKGEIARNEQFLLFPQ